MKTNGNKILFDKVVDIIVVSPDNSTMTIFKKRILCNGNKCRKWKHLDANGYCEKCSTNTENDKEEEEDDVCGMCPLSSSQKKAPGHDVESSDTTMMIQCDFCAEWFHAACTGSKDYVDFISREEPSGTSHSNGCLAVHLWFCSNCHKKEEAILKSLKNSIKNVALSSKAAEDVVTTSKDTGRSLPSSNIALVKDNVEAEVQSSKVTFTKSSTPICRFYRKGFCRHGSSGSTLWENQTCKFRHPKKCFRYCKFGNDPVKGCLNKDCSYLHPMLCRKSTRFGQCFNENCTYQHLSGTVRSSFVPGYHSQRNDALQSFAKGNYIEQNDDCRYARFNKYRLDNNNQPRRVANSHHDMNTLQSGNPARLPKYGNNFSNKQQGFKIDPLEFPSLHEDSNYIKNNAPTITDISIVLKNIQQEIQMLKLNQLSTKDLQNAGNQVTSFPNAKSAKNAFPQPAMYGQ